MPSLTTTPIELYGEMNKKFTLFSYTPVHPHGSGQYNRNPLPPSLPRGYVRDYSKAAREIDKHAEVTLNAAIEVGRGRRFQIVSCKVTRFPRVEASAEQQEPLSEMRNNKRINLERELVLRICDPEYYPSDFMAPCGNEELAEGDFSRDYWAMRHFHERGITGVGYLGPRFYGGWILKLPAGTDRRRKKLFRYVYVSITEKLYGYTVDDLCFRSGPGNEGWLIPHDSPADFERADGSLRWITFDQKTRDKVMKLVLHGLVVSMHNSVEHLGFGPEAAFVTYRDGNKDLSDVRVVHLGHDETQVWRFTAEAYDDSEVHWIQQLPYPPHPFERFCWEALDDWHGWIPDEEEFEEWLTKPSTFGPLAARRGPGRTC